MKMRTKGKKKLGHRVKRKEKKGKIVIPSRRKRRQRSSQQGLSQAVEFICRKCGYEAYKMARYSHCPLCIVCKRCQRIVRKCTCIEGE